MNCVRIDLVASHEAVSLPKPRIAVILEHLILAH